MATTEEAAGAREERGVAPDRWTSPEDRPMVKTSRCLIARYRLERKIAAGGMGTVYAAVDDRLGRRVAAKILARRLAEDPAFIERFKREARAAAALSHPNIASVFDYGEDGPDHFSVMELVEGEDLARVLREHGPLTPDRVTRIVAQMCAAIDHAHAAGPSFGRLFDRDSPVRDADRRGAIHRRITDGGRDESRNRGSALGASAEPGRPRRPRRDRGARHGEGPSGSFPQRRRAAGRARRDRC